MKPSFAATLIYLIITFTQTVSASPNGDAAVKTLQQAWAVNNYQLSGDEQKKGFEALIAEADANVEAFPEEAPLLIWHGIISSTYAGIHGGLGALKYAKQAKADFEKALSIDPQALNGSAYTSLGVLYFNVPGWPIGFGDNDKAKELLEKALEINAEGIDPNYFYGKFMFKQAEYETALSYFEKALKAEPRPDRPLADKGRLEEIHQAIAKTKEEME